MMKHSLLLICTATPAIMCRKWQHSVQHKVSTVSTLLIHSTSELHESGGPIWKCPNPHEAPFGSSLSKMDLP